jgi:hypothetical protein
MARPECSKRNLLCRKKTRLFWFCAQSTFGAFIFFSGVDPRRVGGPGRGKGLSFDQHPGPTTMAMAMTI